MEACLGRVYPKGMNRIHSAALSVLALATFACAPAPDDEVSTDVAEVRSSSAAQKAATTFADRIESGADVAGYTAARCRSYGTSTKLEIDTLQVTAPEGKVVLHVRLDVPASGGTPARHVDRLVFGDFAPLVTRAGNEFQVRFQAEGVPYRLEALESSGQLQTQQELEDGTGGVPVRCQIEE